VIALLLACVVAPPARAVDALGVARDFCRADGLGHRLSPRELASLAPLVGWRFEPAWDSVVLIRGYQIASPRRAGDTLTVDVDYSVVAEVVAGQVVRKPRVEHRRFRLRAGGGGWVLLGPPPPPHVFEDRADADAFADLLDPKTGAYVSNVAAALKHLGSARGEPSRVTVVALSGGSGLEPVDEPVAGDLVFYLDGTTPYHVGIVEAGDVVLSATLNAGAVKLPLDAFDGERVFMRPRSDAPPPAGAPARGTPRPAR